MSTEQAGVLSSCPLCGAEHAELLFVKSGHRIVRCTACDIAYVENPPSGREIAEMYSFSSGYHCDLAEQGSPAIPKHATAATRYLDLIGGYRQGGRLLDVGCSVGVFLDAARRRGWDAYGVEVSQDTAAVARARGLNVHTGTLADSSFPPRFFDVVTLWDVIEHLADPLETLKSINAILTDNGILALSTPNVDGLFPRLSLALAGLAGVWPHPEPPYHLFQFSKKTIAQAVSDSGFEIVRVVDRRIPLTYTFGTPSHVVRSAKRLAYAAIFAPVALIGPILNSGDQIDVVARKAVSF
jgi:2-polyprenyl-3-methyl-5-hydroxy-6-metoxy-1,4-benzoquinol methylase